MQIPRLVTASILDELSSRNLKNLITPLASSFAKHTATITDMAIWATMCTRPLGEAGGRAGTKTIHKTHTCEKRQVVENMCADGLLRNDRHDIMWAGVGRAAYSSRKLKTTGVSHV